MTEGYSRIRLNLCNLIQNLACRNNEIRILSLNSETLFLDVDADSELQSHGNNRQYRSIQFVLTIESIDKRLIMIIGISVITSTRVYTVDKVFNS